MSKNKIAELIRLAIIDLGWPSPAQIVVERPADENHGDWSSSAALALAKTAGELPHDVAEKLAVKLNEKKLLDLDRVEVAGAGFLNFYIKPEYFGGIVGQVLAAGENYGRGEKKNKKVLVEYSSPNIAKPFTIGHLRSTLIGDAVANILFFSGYDVIRDNHLGDWGTQFGKQIVAIKRWGDLDKISETENPVKELVALYVKFHDAAEKDPALEDEARAEFLKLEQGDAEARQIWQKCVSLSLAEFAKIYDRLRVKFDTMVGESANLGRVEEVYKVLKEKGLVRESEGAEVVFFDGDKLPPMIVRKKDSSSIYAVRDLATDLARKEEYGKDLIVINEVGLEQKEYLQQIFETEKMLGWFKKGERIHVGHGLYRFKDGKMSTRKGNVIWLEEVLTEAVKLAGEFNPDVAEIVGIGALKYNDLKRDSGADILFDWKEVLNLKGNSGPYLQYAYARAKSILDKSGKTVSADLKADLNDLSVEKKLERWPETVERAAREDAPHHIATYLYELASIFSNYYERNQIIGGPEEAYRLALTQAVARTLKTGLSLLGIAAPERV